MIIRKIPNNRNESFRFAGKKNSCYTGVTNKRGVDATTNRRTSVGPDKSGRMSAQKLWEFEWNLLSLPSDWTRNQIIFWHFYFFSKSLI